MCGIAGVLVPGDGAVDDQALRDVTTAVRHRGPDGEGYFFDDGIGLGHRRLAIIDVDGGKQPLFAANGQVATIVNGEIYNFRILRKQLEARGCVFATRSDSEVVAHGYAEWGTDVLDRIEGQFALAIWDKRSQTLLLARDRMGEKPLYYARLGNGTLVFASELRALCRYPGVGFQVDADALVHYLVYEYVPAPRAMVRGVRKLCPGQALVARRDSRAVAVNTTTYWDIPVQDHPAGGREADLSRAADELRARLSRSVEDRLVSDVPLGIFLSGGLDSSLVAALASEQRGGDIDTFSIGFSDPSYDESSHARTVAAAIGSCHHERRVDAADLLALIPSLGTLLDEPLGDGSLVPTHLLCQFAREHVTVVLGGDGGDELFAGYPTFAVERIGGAAIDALPGPVLATARRIADLAGNLLPVSDKNFSVDFKLRQVVRGSISSPARRHQAWLGSFLPDEMPHLLHGDLALATSGVDPFAVAEQRLRACRATGKWDRLLYFYCKGYLGDDILAKVNRASMAVSLEVRAPLLDRDIIELACRVTPGLRQSALTGKRVLKRAARGLVPDSVIRRPKKGFGMPIAGWLRNELRDYLEDTLSEQRVARDGLFNPNSVRRLVSEHVTGRANHRKPLWTLLAFHAWLDN